jgi:hypothetical protein
MQKSTLQYFMNTHQLKFVYKTMGETAEKENNSYVIIKFLNTRLLSDFLADSSEHI